LEPVLFGKLISQTRGSATHFYSDDALGSIDRITDTTGVNVTDRYIYKAFGEIQFSTGITANPFQYVGTLGYYRDNDLGLYFLKRRYYAAPNARFLSTDSAGHKLSPLRWGLNLYLYAANNPALYSDPSGLLFQKDHGSASFELGPSFAELILNFPPVAVLGFQCAKIGIFYVPPTFGKPTFQGAGCAFYPMQVIQLLIQSFVQKYRQFPPPGLYTSTFPCPDKANPKCCPKVGIGWGLTSSGMFILKLPGCDIKLKASFITAGSIVLGTCCPVGTECPKVPPVQFQWSQNIDAGNFIFDVSEMFNDILQWLQGGPRPAWMSK
jgi:RHS repeat-associated protein